MALIDIRNVTFRYDTSYQYIFENVSFQIDTNWKLGFTGRNGRGKTTFLNLLLNKYEYLGHIDTNYTFTYFPYVVEDQTVYTITIMEDIVGEIEYWKIQKELRLLEVEEEVLYRCFNTLSNGEQTKVLLAALFLKEDEYLLIDEPTNHLDANARKIVSNYLKQKKAYILVSHDRAFLDACIDHILVINKTNIEVQTGTFSTWYQNKKNQDQAEVATNAKLKKEIDRLNKASKQTTSWSDKIEKSKNGQRVSGLRPDRGFIGHKSAKMMQRAKNTQRRQQEAVEQKSTLLKNIEEYEDLKIHPLKYPSHTLVVLDHVSIYYDRKEVCKDISFVVEQGQRICLNGKNGCGKSSILKLIEGQDITYSGTLKKGSQLVIAKVEQDTSHLQGSLDQYAIDNQIDQTLFKTILRKLDFSREQFENTIETYSGGQKKKVLLAKALSMSAHLYIFDEPLNYIDVFSRIQIEKVIKNSQATILFVEHDQVFKETIATNTINI